MIETDVYNDNIELNVVTKTKYRLTFPCGAGMAGEGELSRNVGRDVPTSSVTFSGYFSGTEAYFCVFLLGPVHMFASFSGADAPDINLHSTCE